MTDEELAATRALLYDEEAGDPTKNLTSEWASVRYNAEVRLAARALLDEVERLRAHVAELEADVERRRQALEFANDRIRRRDQRNAESDNDRSAELHREQRFRPGDVLRYASLLTPGVYRFTVHEATQRASDGAWEYRGDAEPWHPSFGPAAGHMASVVVVDRNEIPVEGEPLPGHNPGLTAWPDAG